MKSMGDKLDQVNIKYSGTRTGIDPEFLLEVMSPRESLASIRGKDRLRILFFSKRSEFFDFNDLVASEFSFIEEVSGFRSEEELLECADTFDIAIVCNHVFYEQAAHIIIRQRKLASLVISWTYDNHHSCDINRATVAFSDVVLVAHAFAEKVFYSQNTLLGRSFPLATGQWTRKFAMEATNLGNRSNKIFGGYNTYGVGEREDIIRKVREAEPENALDLIGEKDRKLYFSRSLADRFREWSSYKTHLSLPLAHDLSCRFFDSLVCGQIPLVSRDCWDLDTVISSEDQEYLPVIRHEPGDVASILAAHRYAISRFDDEGEVGVLRRRDFAIRKHHISVRISEIAKYFYEIAGRQIGTTIHCGEWTVKWTIDDFAP